MIRSTWSYAVIAGFAGIALVATGCSDEGPVAPTQTLTPEAAVSATADRYIVLMKESRTGALSATGMTAELGKMGGRVERSHAQSACCRRV